MPETNKILEEAGQPSYEELVKKIEELEAEATTGFPTLKNALSETLPNLLNFLIGVLIAIVLIFLGYQLIKLILKGMNAFMERRKMRGSVKYVITVVSKTIMTLFLVLSVARIVGVKTASFVALLGSFGIALGLALKGSLSDMAAGLLILFLQPIRVGNIVYIDNLDSPRLRVKQIRLFQTVFRDVNNFEHIVPNGEIISNKVINLSKSKYIRIEIVTAIAYDSNIEKAREIMMDVFKKEEKIIDSKEPSVIIRNLGESGIEIVGRIWVKPNDYLDVKFRMLEEVKKKFDENGVVIPFSQIDIFIKNLEKEKIAEGQ